jgi:hypothetical protein
LNAKSAGNNSAALGNIILYIARIVLSITPAATWMSKEKYQGYVWFDKLFCTFHWFSFTSSSTGHIN